MLHILHDFVSQGPNEISVSSGETVRKLGEPTRGWIKIERQTSGKPKGFVPSSFVVPVTATTTTTEKKKEVVALKPQPSAPPLPRFPSQVAPTIHVAVEHAECAVCFDVMSERPVSVFVDKSKKKRTCLHYFHSSCIESLIRSGVTSCPVCRTWFGGFREIPKFDVDPIGFFETIDADGNGKLSKREVVEMLKALFDIDYRELERDVDSFWSRWDTNGDGELSFEETSGLMEYVRRTFTRGTERLGPPPKLTPATRREWFQYFDEDNSSTLDKEELVRALVKTFGLSTNLGKLNELKDTVENVFGVFDTDGNGTVDMNEFVAPDGLAETLIASLAWSSHS